MSKYAYTATTVDGEKVKGVEEAVTLTQARMALVQRDLDNLELREKRRLLDIEFTPKKVKRKELMHFSRQLAVFIRSGIPIIDGLETIGQDAGSKPLQKVLVEMAEALRGGSTFAEAAERQPHAFPPMYLGILRSAELTGNLDTVLEQLADYIDRDLEARQKVVSALLYPTVVMVMAMASTGILVTYVLPKFTEFFESLDAELPLPTRIMINSGKFVGDWWWLVGIGILAFLFSIAAILRTERGKVWRDKLLLKAPVIGDIVRHAILERFCRILSSMVQAGVPLPEALSVTSDATNNRVYRAGLATARASMMEGQGLAGPLTATGLFPPSARQMFKVGENTGSLDKQLATAAEYFDRELDYKLKRFTSLFEPAVILVAGGVVGFIAISMVSAMYGIFRQVEL